LTELLFSVTDITVYLWFTDFNFTVYGLWRLQFANFDFDKLFFWQKCSRNCLSKI